MEIKDLTGQDIAVLAETFNKKYRAYLMDPVQKLRFFELSALRNHQGVSVKVILQNPSKTYYYPVEARIADEDHDYSPKEAALFLFDYIDCYFEEYLKKQDVYIPIDWSEFEFDGMPFQLKGQVFNLHLEHLADRILDQQGMGESHIS
jgi:hypothetical protein